MFAQVFEQKSADAGIDFVPVRRARGEVGEGLFVCLALGGDVAFGGGDGFAFGGELGARAGAVVRVGFVLLLACQLFCCGLGVFVEMLQVVGQLAEVVVLMLVEIAGGDLQGVKEKSGAAWVDVVACDGDGGGGERLLDVGAGLQARRQDDGVVAGLALADLVGRAAVFAMEVAEVGAAQGGAATLSAAVEDVAAASAVLGVLCVADELFVVHEAPWYLICKILETLGLGRGYLPLRVKCEGPASEPGLLRTVLKLRLAGGVKKLLWISGVSCCWGAACGGAEGFCGALDISQS
ncbi:MAG TPA: hypothetical protein VIM62_13280 [Acidobacteriaceae bacterium]